MSVGIEFRYVESSRVLGLRFGAFRVSGLGL